MAAIEFRGGGKKGGNEKNPWRVQIRKKGFPSIQKSFATESEARIWATETERGIELSKNTSTLCLPKLPLKVWIDRWFQEIGPTRQNLNKEIRLLNFWKGKLGNEIAVDISPSLIEGYADEILKTVGKNGTVLSFETRRKYLLFLSSLYSLAMRQWKWATFNPLTCVDMLRRKDRENRSLLKVNDPSTQEFIERFRSLVRAKMEERGLSQRDAAELCGMTLHTFQYAVFSGDNTTIKSFLKICSGLNLKVIIE
jgi:hypothetical protein